MCQRGVRLANAAVKSEPGDRGDAERGQCRPCAGGEQTAEPGDRHAECDERKAVAERSDCSYGPQPAQFVADQIAETALIDAGLHHHVGEHGAQSDPARQLSQSIIVRQLIGDRCEPADARKNVAADRDRRTEGERAGPGHGRNPDRGDEPLVDELRSEQRPQTRSGVASIGAGDDADLRVEERADDFREVVLRDSNIAVGNHQIVVPGEGHHVDEIADLAAAAVLAAIDGELHVDVRKLAAQPVDHIDGGILAVGNPEDDLKGWIRLFAKRPQALVQFVLCTAKRLEYRHRRGGPVQIRQPGAVAQTHGERGRDRVGHGRGGERRAAPNHRQMSRMYHCITPQPLLTGRC